MTGIDLFAGVGGMSTGAIQAGIDVALAVECDKNAATAYRRNHPGCDVFPADIRHLSADKIKSVPRDHCPYSSICQSRPFSSRSRSHSVLSRLSPVLRLHRIPAATGGQRCTAATRPSGIQGNSRGVLTTEEQECHETALTSTSVTDC